MQLPT
jgi:hypothetical protein